MDSLIFNKKIRIIKNKIIPYDKEDDKNEVKPGHKKVEWQLPEMIFYNDIKDIPVDFNDFFYHRLYRLFKKHIETYSTDDRNSSIDIINDNGKSLYTIRLIDGHYISFSIVKHLETQKRPLVFVDVYPDKLEELYGFPRKRILDKYNLQEYRKHHTKEGVALWIKLVKYIELESRGIFVEK